MDAVKEDMQVVAVKVEDTKNRVKRNPWKGKSRKKKKIDKKKHLACEGWISLFPAKTLKPRSVDQNNKTDNVNTETIPGSTNTKWKRKQNLSCLS